MILLDTHVLVHYLVDDKTLGRRAIASIDKALALDDVFVSAISFWEIAMLVAKGRIQIEGTVAAFRAVALRYGIREEPLDGEIGIAAAELSSSHGDPADRMLVATSVLRTLTLVTADDTLLDWKLRGFRTQDATV